MINDPTFVTIMADSDQHARWITHTDATDILDAYRTAGVYILATLNPDGTLTLAFKPGRNYETTWSPPVTMERR